ncbi:MAG: hypothetical protein RR212_07075 [Bacteroidales bacterium]
MVIVPPALRAYVRSGTCPRTGWDERAYGAGRAHVRDGTCPRTG